MAKKSVVERNKKRIMLSAKYDSVRSELRARRKDQTISPLERLIAQDALSKLSRDSSKVRVRSRCVLTGRGRGVYKKFGISRCELRNLCANGFVPGVVKSSW